MENEITNHYLKSEATHPTASKRAVYNEKTVTSQPFQGALSREAMLTQSRRRQQPGAERSVR